MEKFDLQGSDVHELAKAFSNLLGEAAVSDFPWVLLPTRDFVM